MSQSELAEKLHLGKHQIISNIENGIRAVSSDEMFRLIEIFGEPMEFFTDPYRIVDEKVLSFRARSDAEGLSSFEDQVSKLASAAIRFSDLCGEEINPFDRQLKVDHGTTLASASYIGTQVANRLELGAVPAERLQDAIERKLGIMVLNVDAPLGISGSACHMPPLDMITINRKEPDFRRNFDLAHELFHVLTWSALPPQRHDWSDQSRPKEEKLADAFAAGLLLPDSAVRARWETRKTKETLADWILRNAKEMKVSGQAFYYRLVNLRLLGKTMQEEIDLNNLSRSDDAKEQPRLFCESFVKRMHKVVGQGKVSTRKAASLAGLEVDELPPLFASYGLAPAF
ncbi:MAG: ImmA/IrrE family metallo-endopeptidase [Opitutales bacterium]|nr:ImmA/IrrE family metallo-endopeptidase [Opitutales bacterium]